MLRPSGETCGSAAHCRSNTSSGFNAGFCDCARPGALTLSTRIVAAQICLTEICLTEICLTEVRLTEIRSSIVDLIAGSPAVTLMFIHDSHGLHEGVTNG